MSTPTRCISCPTKHTRVNRQGQPAKRCDSCAAQHAKAQRKRRQVLKAEGLARGVCTVCGADRDRPEVQLCSSCRQTNSKHVRAYQRKKSLPRRRRAARKRTQRSRAERARAQARELADTLLRQLSCGLVPQRSVQ